MSNLLHIIRLKSKATERGHLPLMLEFHVSPETAPYLVSSSSSVMWIGEAHPNDRVMGAVREMTPGQFFTEIVEAVTSMGREMDWGNIHPLTVEGLQAAIDHVTFFDFTDLELLVPRVKFHESDESDEDDEDDEGSDEAVARVLVPEVSPAMQAVLNEFDLPRRPSSWVPDDTVIVVPRDRTFVGIVVKATGKKIAGVVHNAARGIGIARGLNAPADESSSDLPVDAGG